MIEISEEQLELLGDLDVIGLVRPGRARLDSNLHERLAASTLYQNLAIAREGRTVFIENPMHTAALAFSGVLSLPIALDALVPMLAAAVDGDPATQPTPTSP